MVELEDIGEEVSADKLAEVHSESEEDNDSDEEKDPKNQENEGSESGESARNPSEADGSEEDGKEGEETKQRYTPEEEAQMCEYMHRFTHDKDTPDMVEKFIGPLPNRKKFWRGYLEATGSSRHALALSVKYPKLIRKLHLIRISTEMKMDLYYSLSIPIHEDFMETVRKEVNIAMDENRIIEAFEMKSVEQMQREAKIKQKRTPKKTPTKRKSLQVSVPIVKDQSVKRRKLFDEETDIKMWMFLHSKLIDPVTKSITKNEKFKPKSMFCWREFFEEQGDVAKAEDKNELKKYGQRYDSMKKHLHKVPLDGLVKLELYYGLSIPINSEFLELISRTTRVSVDEEGLVLEYTSLDQIRSRVY